MRRSLGFLVLVSSVVGCSGGEADTAPSAPPNAGSTAGSGGSGGGASAGSGGAAGGAGATAGAAGAGGEIDLGKLIAPSKSCAYKCDQLAKCPEAASGYSCQNLADWASLPHADACGAWDGKQPAAAQGQCTASAPTDEAVRYAGPHPSGGRVLPDGRRIHPAGEEFVFDEPDFVGGLTTTALLVPGTSLALTVDSGNGPHAVRAVDTTKLSAAGGPVTSAVKFPGDVTLSSAAIAFVAPDLVLVGTADGKLQALKLDTTTGALSIDDARSIPLPVGQKPYYVGGLAVSPDGAHAVVSGVDDTHLYVLDVGTSSPTYGTQLGSLDLGASETFAVAFDPNDAKGTHAYVTLWGGKAVLDVDLTSPAAPTIARKFDVEKDPEGLAFLDARWMLVANDFGDSISIVDRTAGTVTTIPAVSDATLHGHEPSALAYDAKNGRLYASHSGTNAIAAYAVDSTKSPPTITLLGRLPTSWWPSGVSVRDDGAIVVPSMRGHGSGPKDMMFGIGDSDIADRMRGGIQVIPMPDGATIDQGEATVAASNDVRSLPGQPTVTCPSGVADFPLPPTNDAGPSPVIKRVFFMLRENKDFDGVFGDLQGVEGDPTLTLKATSAEMDAIWVNARTLARTFSISDNYYTDAVYSTQGHTWATYGRATDFDERTWAISGGGHDARPVPGSGILEVGRPVEGSLFDWLGKNKIAFDILGEIVGAPDASSYTGPSPSDASYPGGPFQNILYPDVEKACYTAGRLRVLCDTKPFVYMTITNDHTGGVGPNSPSPETYCAGNDEATGMFVDALSHSPFWKESLLVVTEDDPSQGGEHIDSHRTPLILISPWVKRGYVSKTHIDAASLHKLFAHVFGIPYSNAEVAAAALPFDAFTSTPDYTPYAYVPRKHPATCGNEASMAEQELTSAWDFDEADEQPGLDAQVTRWMRGMQLEELPPRLRAFVERRKLERAHPSRRRGDD